jgi:hypothetical protein
MLLSFNYILIMQVYRVKAGESVLLECEVENLKDMVLLWKTGSRYIDNLVCHRYFSVQVCLIVHKIKVLGHQWNGRECRASVTGGEPEGLDSDSVLEKGGGVRMSVDLQRVFYWSVRWRT